jgi:hypothetical protein
MLIAQISDLHIKPAGQFAYRRIDTAAALARCIKELNRFVPRPDLVVISGDLVDAPSKKAYDNLVALLSSLEIPFAAVPGNHDDRDLMRAALPGGYARQCTRCALSAMSTSCSWIRRSRVAITVPWTWRASLGSKAFWRLRHRARRCCSCTTRRLPPVSATWTCKTCATPATLPPFCTGIRGCGSLQPGMCTAPR